MAHGRGIYLSENPVFCSKFGDKLILCRVLLGNKDGTNSATLSLGPYYNSNYYRVNTVDQIVPYCIINLKSQMKMLGSNRKMLADVFRIIMQFQRNRTNLAGRPNQSQNIAPNVQRIQPNRSSTRRKVLKVAIN